MNARLEHRDPAILRAQVTLLRATLRLILQTIGSDSAGRVVDLARPNVSLRAHVEAVLRDTR